MSGLRKTAIVTGASQGSGAPYLQQSTVPSKRRLGPPGLQIRFIRLAASVSSPRKSGWATLIKFRARWRAV